MLSVAKVLAMYVEWFGSLSYVTKDYNYVHHLKSPNLIEIETWCFCSNALTTQTVDILGAVAPNP